MTAPIGAPPENSRRPQDDDTVADFEDLGQFVGDEDDARAFRAQPAKDREQVGDLARREVGGRLVEDQEVRLAQHSFQDFDPLPAAEREVRDHRIRLEIEAEAAARLANALRHFPAPQEPARRRPPEHDILDHAHRLDQHEVLMDHRDARRHGVRRAMAGESPAAEDD